MTQYIYSVVVFLSIMSIPYVLGSALLPKVEEKPLRWSFGLFIIGIFFLCAYVAAIPQMYATVAGVAILLICAGKMFLQANGDRKYSKNILPVHFPLLVISASLSLFFLYCLTDIAVTPIYSQDGIVTWLGKAKDFYYWNPLSSLRYVQYPGLGSMLWAVIMMVFGFYESYGRFIYPIFYGMFFLFIWSSIKTQKYLHAVYISLLLFFFFQPTLYNGYQDDFLSLTAGFSVLLFSLYILDMEKTYRYVLGCFFAGSLGLIKSEGVLLGIIILGVFLACYGKNIISAGKKQFLVYISGIFLALSLLAFWSISIFLHGINPGNIQGEGLTMQSIIEGYKNFNRLPIIGTYLYAYFFKNPLFLFIIIFSVITAVTRPFLRKIICCMIGIILLHTIALMYVYLTTKTPLIWQLETSFFRLMDQHVSMYILLAVCCLQLIAGRRSNLHSSLV